LYSDSRGHQIKKKGGSVAERQVRRGEEGGEQLPPFTRSRAMPDFTQKEMGVNYQGEGKSRHNATQEERDGKKLANDLGTRKLPHHFKRCLKNRKSVEEKKSQVDPS